MATTTRAEQSTSLSSGYKPQPSDRDDFGIRRMHPPDSFLSNNTAMHPPDSFLSKNTATQIPV